MATCENYAWADLVWIILFMLFFFLLFFLPRRYYLRSYDVVDSPELYTYRPSAVLVRKA